MNTTNTTSTPNAKPLPTFTYKGEVLTLAPLTPDDLPKIEQHLNENRQSLLRHAAQQASGLPPFDANLLIDRALARVEQGDVTTLDVAEWLDTRAGVAYCVWLMLSKQHGDRFKLSDLTDIFLSMGRDAFQQAADARDQAAAFVQTATT